MMYHVIPLVEYARAKGERPRVHPNGFLQLNLSSTGTIRLHIWHDELPKQNVRTSVHDHIFDMHSTIYKGRLSQYRKTYELDHGANPSHEIYMAKYMAKSQSSLQPTGVLVRASNTMFETVDEGYSYTQPAFTFHDSNPLTPIVVTVMTKTVVHKDYDYEPRVLVPIGQEPDNSFVREDTDEDFLWKIIEESV